MLNIKRHNKLLSALGITLLTLAVSGNATAKSPKHRALERSEAGRAVEIGLQDMLDVKLARVEARFSRLDTDEDMLVSLEEYLAGQANAIDLSLYAEEIVQCVAELKEETEDENIVVPDVSRFKSPEERFANRDLDSDGYISLEEAVSSTEEKVTRKFESLDADDSGTVSREELKAKKSERKASRRATKNCIDEVTAEDDIL